VNAKSQEIHTVLSLIRRFRGPLVALIALTFSASVALAGQPASPGATGLSNAATHAGKTVPVQAADEQTGQDETTEPDESTDETADTSDSADHCSTDPTTLTPEELAALNHGAVVCWAAHQATPEGFANHGAWVSSWAKQNHGADASATGKSHKPSN
jgi:hypothetical protein